MKTKVKGSGAFRATLLTALISWASGANAFASEPSAFSLDLGKGTGSVEFHAVGRPSALKIVGKGLAATGIIKFVKTKSSGAATFDLSTLNTGIDLRDKHMKEKYLEVGKFPKATLTLNSLSVSENFTGEKIPFQGMLMLHGVEQPVSGSASLKKTGNQMTVVADFPVQLDAHGITIPSFAGITVAKEVNVTVTSTSPITQSE